MLEGLQLNVVGSAYSTDGGRANSSFTTNIEYSHKSSCL